MSLSKTIAAAQYNFDFLTDFQQWKNKTEEWVRVAALAGATYLLFPEYGAMELTSLLNETERKNLKGQAAALRQFLPQFILAFQELSQKYKVVVIAPSFPVLHDTLKITNRVYVFSPSGKYDFQDKIFMTRFEDEEWGVTAGEAEIKTFTTEDFKFSVITCFDIEFAFGGLTAAHNGAEVLFVPSCTETLKGAHRVHIGARARALENQLFTVVAQTVGDAPWSPAVDQNNGFAAFYSPPDVGFNEDGILKSGKLNEVPWVYADLRFSHLEKVRSSGAVFNYKNHVEFLKNREPFFTIKNVIL